MKTANTFMNVFVKNYYNKVIEILAEIKGYEEGLSRLHYLKGNIKMSVRYSKRNTQIAAKIASIKQRAIKNGHDRKTLTEVEYKANKAGLKKASQIRN
jgi:hypothetical protein